MKSIPLISLRPGKRRGGFSLVEVTLALGIVAFALIPLLGLVPIGLTAANATMKETAESHILQQIAGDIGMLSFNDLDAYIARTYDYDYEGRPVASAAQAIYRVTLARKDAAFPGSGNGPGIANHLQQVVVTFAYPSAPASTASRTTLSVSNNGL